MGQTGQGRAGERGLEGDTEPARGLRLQRDICPAFHGPDSAVLPTTLRPAPRGPGERWDGTGKYLSAMDAALWRLLPQILGVPEQGLHPGLGGGSANTSTPAGLPEASARSGSPAEQPRSHLVMLSRRRQHIPQGRSYPEQSPRSPRGRTEAPLLGALPSLEGRSGPGFPGVPGASLQGGLGVRRSERLGGSQAPWRLTRSGWIV